MTKPSMSPTVSTTLPTGLSTAQAAQGLIQYGANELAQPRPHLLLALLGKFWSPVPWMLELAIVLQLLLGKRDEALVIALLLCMNALLGFLQEGRANAALALLQQRLNIQARVMRDGRWQSLTARELVPGDRVHVRMGDIVPADLQLVDGDIELDQSSLTGESLPVEAKAGAAAFQDRW